MKSLAEVTEEAVHRIVDEIHPLRLVLFGSAARDDAGPDSDLDFLVVMPDGADRVETAYRAHRGLRGFERPCDIVVVLESEVPVQAQNVSLVIHTALTEGRELYHAA